MSERYLVQIDVLLFEIENDSSGMSEQIFQSFHFQINQILFHQIILNKYLPCEASGEWLWSLLCDCSECWFVSRWREWRDRVGEDLLDDGFGVDWDDRNDSWSIADHCAEVSFVFGSGRSDLFFRWDPVWVVRCEDEDQLIECHCSSQLLSSSLSFDVDCWSDWFVVREIVWESLDDRWVLVVWRVVDRDDRAVVVDVEVVWWRCVVVCDDVLVVDGVFSVEFGRERVDERVVHSDRASVCDVSDRCWSTVHFSSVCPKKRSVRREENVSARSAVDEILSIVSIYKERERRWIAVGWREVRVRDCCCLKRMLEWMLLMCVRWCWSWSSSFLKQTFNDCI